MKTHVLGLARSVVRHSSTLLALSYKARGIRRLDSLVELDDFLDTCMAGAPEVTPQALARMSKAYLRLPASISIPADPFSQEYERAQDDLYALIAGKAYDHANESTGFEFEKAKDDFFPYNTGSGAFVGEQLMSHGFLLKHMDLPKGARVVEFGAGWGNLTLHLAMMGCRMTAVELNRPSIALMAHRAGLHGRTIEFAEQDMVEFSRTTKERFDAAVFVASFHHARGHQELIRNLGRLVKEDGAVYFASEPVPPVGGPALPYPWGLRMDAPSLYYVRRHGWLELGFGAAYFRSLLARNGWDCRTVLSEIWGLGDLQIATRRKS